MKNSNSEKYRKAKAREIKVIFPQEGQEQGNDGVNKTQLLLIILGYISRNLVLGITPFFKLFKKIN